MNPRLPKPQEPIANRDGTVTRSWLDYLRGLAAGAQIDELTALIEEAKRAIEEIQQRPGLPSDTRVFGLQSIQSQGALEQGAVIFTLVNDQAQPAPGSYYGTDDGGALGYHLIPEPPAAGFLPMTTGEIVDGQPVFLYGPDGRLIYGPVN